jgi:hypothetical protein
MWQAFENVKPLVRRERGHVYIAIYNDLGEITDRWAEVKRRYNALPRPLSLPLRHRCAGGRGMERSAVPGPVDQQAVDL